MRAQDEVPPDESGGSDPRTAVRLFEDQLQIVLSNLRALGLGLIGENHLPAQAPETLEDSSPKDSDSPSKQLDEEESEIKILSRAYLSSLEGLLSMTESVRGVEIMGDLLEEVDMSRNPVDLYTMWTRTLIEKERLTFGRISALKVTLNQLSRELESLDPVYQGASIKTV